MSSNPPASTPGPSSGSPAGAPVPPPVPSAPPVPTKRSGKQRSQPLPKDRASVFTRAGALWTSLIVGFLVLILLLIFIAQNTAPTPFTFLGWHWTLPLGVAFLFAAVFGGLITVAVGTARIIQLRHAAKKNLSAGIR